VPRLLILHPPPSVLNGTTVIARKLLSFISKCCIHWSFPFSFTCCNDPLLVR
jgi:hypothetical protein